MSMFSGLFGTIRGRLTYGTLSLALIPLILAGSGLTYFALQTSRAALEARAYDQLRSTGAIKVQEVQAYIAGLVRELQQLSANPAFVSGSPQMAQAQLGLAATLPVPVVQARAELKAWYLNTFKPQYDAANPTRPMDFESIVDALPDDTVAVQYLYIAKNPNQQSRDEYIDAGDGSAYTQAHVGVHTAMLDALEHSNYFDLHIADPATGNLFYTSAKETDIGTNLNTGPLKDTGMAQSFREALKIQERHGVWMSEYASFYPAVGESSAFISTPIYASAESKDIVGILIGQFPVDALNTLMTFEKKWSEVGLGASGETYLIGPDKTPRSVSRFLAEDINGFLALMQQIGLPANLINEMRGRGTNIGIQPVDTYAVQRAQAGETNISVFPDYRNIPVLGFYTPIKLLNITWSLHSEIDEAEAFASVTSLQRNLLIAAVASIGVLGLLALLVGRRLASSINTPLAHFGGVVEKVARGDNDVRVRLPASDEIGKLSVAFDHMLDERIATQLRIERENEQLNNSVVEIMTSVAELAGRNLNIRVPVSEDVTGAVSDAINMMTRSTANALGQVRRISDAVSESSLHVRQRSEQVEVVANAASEQATAAAAEIQQTATALRQMGVDATQANAQAERALKTTSDALDMVRATVSGISSSRDQIRETEKRVKRLAERSQEITGVVNIIGQIAERTSVLALNASMQAVAAGDAGRGFAVVADEVKRLAENARQATQQIGSLVTAIQTDASETIQAMNGTIAQVVDISKLADQAGGQMNDTRSATELLVTSVKNIASATNAQSQSSQTLLTRAYQLLQSSQQTLDELTAQRSDTESLTESARRLVSTVGEFKLPESA